MSDIILVLLAIIGVAIVIALGLAISALIQVFSLARTVRKEIAGVGALVRGIGEGVVNKLDGGIGVLDFLKKSKKAAKPKKNA